MKITEFTVCPSTLAEGFADFSPQACAHLFDGVSVSPFTSLIYAPSESKEPIQRVSVSGVQEKLFAVVDNKALRKADVAKSEQSRYIVKPTPNNPGLRNVHEIPVNEHLTMQIARQVYGIDTAYNGIIVLKDGRPGLLVKRFDIQKDGSKLFQEDLASLSDKTASTHGTDYKYQGSYLEMAEIIKKHIPTWRFEMVKFFTLVLFNHLFANGDAHLKNFSILIDGQGVRRFAPAYDLLNTSLHVDDGDFAMTGGLGIKQLSDSYDLTKHPTFADFFQFGLLCGLTVKQVKKAIAPFRQRQPMVYDLCQRSFFSNKCKRMYLRSYEERLARLLREDAD